MKRLAAFAILLGLGSCQGLARESIPLATGNRASVDEKSAQAELRGATYAQAQCSGCHSVGTRGQSPLLAAPAFRTLGLRYPVADLAEAFAEGIVTAHPAMPEFVMSTTENADMIAYLQSIQNPDRP